MNALGTFAPQGKFIFGQGKRWLADLTDDHLALEPIAGTKTAGGLVGHLSVTGDFGRVVRDALLPVIFRRAAKSMDSSLTWMHGHHIEWDAAVTR